MRIARMSVRRLRAGSIGGVEHGGRHRHRKGSEGDGLKRQNNAAVAAARLPGNLISSAQPIGKGEAAHSSGIFSGEAARTTCWARRR